MSQAKEASASAGESSSTTADESSRDLPSNRFELELEFIQCLASPAYLHHLATSGLLSDPSFLSFLEYLRYWSRPEYARFLTYPHCLYFLDLLTTNETFRREMANVAFRNFVHEQQFYSWQFRSRNLYGRGVPDEEKASAMAGGAEAGGERADSDTAASQQNMLDPNQQKLMVPDAGGGASADAGTAPI